MNLVLFLATGALAWTASHVHAVTVTPGIPGTNLTEGNPTAIVANFYQFALMLAGLLAFGAIVYGGIKYALATGDPGGQSDARQWITQALWGLLLLVGAVLVLRTINPDLATPSLPGFTEKLPVIKPPSGLTCDECSFRDPNKPSCGFLAGRCDKPPIIPRLQFRRNADGQKDKL